MNQKSPPEAADGPGKPIGISLGIRLGLSVVGRISSDERRHLWLARLGREGMSHRIAVIGP
jgi:hypothetical protein